MSHRRAKIRAALRLALRVDPYFAGVEVMSAWSTNVDAETLPVLGVATPRESKDQDAQNSAERATTAIVVLKRLGGEDIEDVLDIDSDHVEVLVLGVIRTMGLDAMLDQTDIGIDGAAERRVGTLTMTFRAFAQTPEPLTI